MSKRGPQLPRVKPVGRAALNPRHPHRDDDLAYIMENWPQIASAAWVGYLAQGRGLTIVDTRKTYPVPTGLSHAISYLPTGCIRRDLPQRLCDRFTPNLCQGHDRRGIPVSTARGGQPPHKLRNSSFTALPP